MDHPVDAIPWRSERLEPVLALDGQERKRVAVDGEVESEVSREADRHQTDGQPLGADSMLRIGVPGQPRVGSQCWDQDQSVHPGERRQAAQDARQPPSVAAGGEERAEHQPQEQALRVADVQEIGGRKDEQEPGGQERGSLSLVGAHQAVEEGSHEQRRDAADQEGRDERLVEDGVDRAHEPGEEREEDDVQRQVAGKRALVAVDQLDAGIRRAVAQDGDVQVVRAVPMVPDLEDSPQARAERLPGDHHDREHPEGQDCELDDQRQTRELEVLALEEARMLRVRGKCLSGLEFLRWRGHSGHASPVDRSGGGC